MGNTPVPESLSVRLRAERRGLAMKQRRLETERLQMNRRKSQLGVRIRKHAEAGEMRIVNMLALEYAKVNDHIVKLAEMGSKLTALSIHVEMMRSNQDMTEALAGLVYTMQQLNATVSITGMQQIIREYEKQNQVLEFTQEICDEALHTDDIDVENERDEIVSRVLDEIGIDVDSSLEDAPKLQNGKQTRNSTRTAVSIGGGHEAELLADSLLSDSGNEQSLEQRLRNLRNR